jgi:protein-S-isoprenylcysteine O-methyltransferase Ste14
MQIEMLFRILVAVLLISFVVHRGLQTRQRTPDLKRVVRKLDTGNQLIVALLSLIALASSLVYIFAPDWLVWANLPIPTWLRWLGVPLAVAGFGLLEWSQAALAKNWSDQPVQLADHTLTQTGPYAWIRHPIYTGFLLILSAPLLLSSNGLVGFAWIAATYLDLINRIRAEEEMLAESFGKKFTLYAAKTGRLLPRIFNQ